MYTFIGQGLGWPQLGRWHSPERIIDYDGDLRRSQNRITEIATKLSRLYKKRLDMKKDAQAERRALNFLLGKRKTPD